LNRSSDSSEEDAAKLAAVLLDLHSLQVRAQGSEAGVQTLEAIRRLQESDLEAARLRIFNTHFEWWQLICSPLHVWVFSRRKRRAKGPGGRALTREECRNLSDLVTRIRYGFYLDQATVSHLQRFVSRGVLTGRDVWRLTHSLGCRVERKSLLPAPINSFFAVAGLVVGVGLSACTVAFGYQAAIGFGSDVPLDLCTGFGYAALSYVFAHVAPLVVCCTWGRRDAAKALTYLLSNDPPVDSSRATAVNRSLLARLAW
jgi:hypothetical protein